jgi:predicted O-methyltransferase YrrM
MSDATAAASQPADFERAWATVADVPGWLTDRQARRLWDGARALVAPARIVEIGSFRGRSTIVLALAAAPGVEVVAIDPHGGGDRGPREIEPVAQLGESDLRAFQENLGRAGVAERVRHVRLASAQALAEVSGPVSLLYVDGAHRYAPARTDLEMWGGRVALGGTLFVHDAFSSIGVTFALWRTVIGRAQWRYRGRSGSLAEYARGELDASERARAVLLGLAQMPWFVRNVLVKLLIVARMRGLARLLGHVSGPWPY